MDFLFEIGLEELPARYIDEAAASLERLIKGGLENERISFKEIEVFSTPRRLAVIVKEIAEKQSDLDRKSIGPAYDVAFKDGKITKAGEGFLRSQGAEEGDIKIVENEKGKYISVEKFVEGIKTKEVLPQLLDEALRKIEFEKSMKWSDKSFRFARPIKWFVTLFGNEVLPFEFEGLKGSNKSRGMRYFASQDIKIDSPADYEKILEENFVIAKKDKRKEAILKSIKENCENDGETAIVNDYLLEEVVNLVEYPYAIKGEYNKDYLLLPEDITTITMETHQRYFPVKDGKGKLTNKFILIRNAPVYSESVKKGNEKVIEPRLADAKFFFDEDLKRPFSANVEKLKEVIFQKDMGTIYEKIMRSMKIAEYLIDTLKLQGRKESILRTVELSKADLVTNVISEKEFTKLQGFMGSVYAEKQGENKDVAAGIFEHYLPRYQGDILPKTMEGVVAGIADKIDTVVGCFSVGLKPTSSKDPYALRRAVQGIVHVILESRIGVDYGKLILKAYEVFSENKKVLAENVVIDVKEFFKQRVANVLSEKYGKELVSYEIGIVTDIIDLDERLSVLEKLSHTEKFDKLINLLKRVKNIVKSEKAISTLTDESLFEKNEERELYNFSIKLENSENKEFLPYINLLLENSDIINNYFDNVMINAQKEKIKNNRVSLLKKLGNSIGKIMDI